MTSFTLRIPTLADMQYLWHHLQHSDYNSLFRPDQHLNTFHLKDTCVTPWKEQVGFRPVLQAETEETLYAVHNGTCFQMTCPEVPGLFYPPETKTVSWMKCGNLLIACRNVTADTPYDLLSELGLLHGLSIDIDFERFISLMYYQKSMEQPDSKPRKISEIMRGLHLQLCHLSFAPSLPDHQLYHIAGSIYKWSQQSTVFSCQQLTDAAADLIAKGLPKYQVQRYVHVNSNPFSPAAIVTVLTTGDMAVFRTLVCMKLVHEVIYDLFGEDLSDAAVIAAFDALHKADVQP